ncbi:Cro/C1-type helix-turn-helix domain [actinobacterium SCGC AAA044-D11]
MTHRLYSRLMIIIPELSIEEIAAAIKTVRKAKGMTLKEVEARSGGVWKAVVIGSYERCDRALSVKKAINLANFYQVPLSELLGLNTQSRTAPREKITIDLRSTNNEPSTESDVLAVKNFANLICAKRHDWNGEVLSIRNSDLTTISLLINRDEATAYDWLQSRRFILGARRP